MENEIIKPSSVGVRFFDVNRADDFARLTEIVNASEVDKWMDDVAGMNPRHTKEWMREKGYGRYYLFAVIITDRNHSEYDKVQGFVYFYPCEWERGSLEVSFAKHPTGPRGLIVPATRKACLRVREDYKIRTGREYPALRILGDVEPENIPSIKALWRSGFELDEEYDDDNDIYVLNWKKLEELEETSRGEV